MARPDGGLLSKDYAKSRAKLIDMSRASDELRAGDPIRFDPDVSEWPFYRGGKLGKSRADIRIADADPRRDCYAMAY